MKSYRDRFHIPKRREGTDVVYLAGNSLGLQPKTTRAYVEQELEDWAKHGVEGHFNARNPWMPYHRLLTAQTARLVGAEESEVVVMNSLTVNLHLLMVSFYRPTADRYKILIEAGAFPSDRYAVASQLRFHNLDPQIALVEAADILAAIEQEGPSIALVLVGGVNYATGEYFDLEAITRAAHQQGTIAGFDLAHAAGNVPLHLHDWNVDFSAWCSYKYLNGGPGAIAGAFIHERHHRSTLPRFEGWWGHDESTRFQMGPKFEAMQGAEAWQLSNPPILQLAALRASMDIFEEAGIENLRKQSEALTGYLEHRLKGFGIVTPGDPARRGAQLSIRVADRGVCNQLAAEGIIADWREPDILRVAPVPLYNTEEDIDRFTETLIRVVLKTPVSILSRDGNGAGAPEKEASNAFAARKRIPRL
jgi:kynureninase